MSKTYLAALTVLYADNIVADNAFIHDIKLRLTRDGVNETIEYLDREGYDSRLFEDKQFAVKPKEGSCILRVQGMLLTGTQVEPHREMYSRGRSLLSASERVLALRSECIKTVTTFMADFNEYAADDFKLHKNRHKGVLLTHGGYINHIESNAIRLETLAKIADHLKSLEDAGRTD